MANKRAYLSKEQKENLRKYVAQFGSQADENSEITLGETPFTRRIMKEIVEKLKVPSGRFENLKVIGNNLSFDVHHKLIGKSARGSVNVNLNNGKIEFMIDTQAFLKWQESQRKNAGFPADYNMGILVLVLVTIIGTAFFFMVQNHNATGNAALLSTSSYNPFAAWIIVAAVFIVLIKYAR